MNPEDHNSGSDHGERRGERAKVSVSVIVPTCNGEAFLGELLAGLSLQTMKADQVLVVDSSSDDNTVAVAREFGAEVHVIDRRSFDHGKTRSLGVQRTSSDVVVLMTQDVLPARRDMLEKLVAPLIRHAEVGMSYARQLPAFDADPIAAHLRLFNYPDRSEIRAFDDRRSHGLGTVFASNSCAAYRRTALEAVGFFPEGLIFGEDTIVAAIMLERGFKIAYVAESLTYHSHNYTLDQEFCRYFDIGVLHRSEPWLLERYGGVGGRGRAYLFSGVDYLREHRSSGLIVEFMVRVALKWIGYQLGRRHRIMPARIATRLSKNKTWWHRNQTVGSDGEKTGYQD